MREDENGRNDYEREEGERRVQRAYERALSARDPFYPPELHEQDVRARFGLDEDEDETGLAG